MQPYLLAHKSTSHRRFGSIGASSTPTTSSFPAPVLDTLGYSLNGIRRVTPLYGEGRWRVKRLPLKMDDNASFVYSTVGPRQSNGYLYATFVERRTLRGPSGEPIKGRPRGNVRQFLFIQPISPANGYAMKGSVTLDIPKDMRGVVFYLTKNLPDGVYADYLTEEATKPLGVPGMVKPLTPEAFRSPALGFVPKVPQIPATVKGQRSDKYDLWDGRLSEHRWSKHGWTGQQLKLDSGSSLNRPAYVATGKPYIAVSFSLYQYREGTYVEYENKELQGWDAVRLSAEIPAGTPMRLVLQCIKHDRDGTFAEWWYAEKGDKLPNTNVWLGCAGNKFIGTGLTKSKPYKVWTGYGSDTVIDYKINPGYSIGRGDELSKDTFVAGPDGGEYTTKRGGGTDPLYAPTDLRHWGMKVEWYDTKSKMWSKPSIHPPWGDQKFDKWGTVGYVFRLPRQLGANNPDLKDTPDWALDPHTWDCYPSVTHYNIGGESKAALSYNVIGRAKVLDASGNTVYPTIDYNGMKLQAKKSVQMDLFCAWGEQVAWSPNFRFAGADPKMYAYINSPAFNNVYWKEGEFAPGSTMVVVGQALTGGMSMVLTKKKNDTPDNVRKRLNDIGARSEGMGGTKDADFLEIRKVITTDQLLDDVESSIEAEVRTAWKNIFGVDLNAQWFEVVGRGGAMADGTTITPLKNQSEIAHMYSATFSGETYKFPYSIAIVKIPNTWVGPVLDFEVAQGEPYLTEKSLKKGEKTYITSKTIFQQIVEQELNLDEEIDQQLELERKGLTPEEVLVGNDADHDAIINTAEVVDTERIENVLDNETEKAAFGFELNFWPFKRKGKLLSDSALRRHTLLPVGRTTRLEGMNMLGFGPTDYEMTDETNRYSADHVTTLGAWTPPPPPYGDDDWNPAGTNFQNFEFDEAFVMQGKPSQPNASWFLGASPEPQPLVRNTPTRTQFGSLNQRAMHARSTGRGNPLEVTLVQGLRPPFRLGALDQ